MIIDYNNNRIMGVKGFSQIINTYAEACVEITQFKDYRGSIQSIDATLAIYRFCLAILNTENFRTNEIITGHLFACFFKTCSMLRYAIMPIWVFDGKPPNIKFDTLNERRKRKHNAVEKLTSTPELNDTEKNRLEKKAFTVTFEQIDEVKTLLKLLGIPFIEAPGEAEAQCAAFDIANISDGVATEDWDVIFFGCKKMLKSFSNKNNVTEINTKKLLNALGMSKEQLIDFASILGNDYCHGINGIKPLDAYHKFKEVNCNINSFLHKLKNENKIKLKYRIPDNFLEQLNEARRYYLHAPVTNPHHITTEWREPNYEGLYNYLVNIKKLKNSLILPKINELHIMYSYYITNKKKLVTLSHIKRELNAQRLIVQNKLDHRRYTIVSFPYLPQVV